MSLTIRKHINGSYYFIFNEDHKNLGHFVKSPTNKWVFLPYDDIRYDIDVLKLIIQELNKLNEAY
jgi:hypothetical protein